MWLKNMFRFQSNVNKEKWEIYVGTSKPKTDPPDLSEDSKIGCKKRCCGSETGRFAARLRDFALPNEHEISNLTTILSSFDEQDFLNVNKFEDISDYSDHGIGKYLMSQEYSEVISRLNREAKQRVLKEIEENLANTQGIYIRSYKEKPQLLRALIIGAKGTPYQDGLYFIDIFLPCSYPDKDIHPTLRLHSAGIQIHPNIYTCGEVSFEVVSEYLKEQGRHTFTILELLVIIKDVLLNKNPLYYERFDLNYEISPSLEQSSVLYNENIIIKSLKLMVYIMNKPPKHFEAFVVGHFRSRARDILMTCKGYMNGRFLNGELENKCSIAFKNEVATCMKPLVDAFTRIGSHEAQDFLHCENIIDVPRKLGSHKSNTSRHRKSSGGSSSSSSGNRQSGSVLSDFIARGDDQLNLTVGEEVEIEYEVDGWFYVKKKGPGQNGKMAGFVPALYVSRSLKRHKSGCTE